MKQFVMAVEWNSTPGTNIPDDLQAGDMLHDSVRMGDASDMHPVIEQNLRNVCEQSSLAESQK